MTDLFLSYSRRDKEFAEKLHAALATQGRDIWVDWEDIPITADWLQEIYDGIDAADAFIFVLTPDSAQSEVCGWEVKHAAEVGKRLIPVVHREVTKEGDREKIHPSINAHNWLFFREEDDFDATFKLLTDALDTDLDHVRNHTKFLVRAKEWEDKERNNGFLLAGDELTEAESWLSHSSGKRPEPLELHQEYVYQSRKAATRRQQQLIVASLGAAAVSILLAIAAVFGFTDANQQRNIANDQRDIAQRNAEVSERLALAASAQTAFIANNNDTAIALALEAVAIDDPPVEAQRILQTSAFAPGMRSVIDAHDGGAFSVAYNADGSRIVTGSQDDTVAVWGTDGELVYRFELHENDLLDTIFTPDGAHVISGDRDGVIHRWNADDGTIVWTYDQTGDTVRAMAITPDGETLIVGTQAGQLIFIAAEDGTEIERLAEAHERRIRDAAVNPEGTLLATTSDDETLSIWDLRDNNRRVQHVEPEIRLTGVTFSTDGTQVIAGAGDFNVYVWNVESGDRAALLSGHVAWINDVVVAPGGVFALSSSNDNSLRVWNLHTGRGVLRLTGHTQGVWDVAFSPGGTQAVSVSWDGTLRIWDIAHGFELARYQGHTNDVSATGFNSDDSRVFTASWDDSMTLWNMETGLPVNTWMGEGGNVTRALYSPDGSNILIGDNAGGLFLFDGETGDLQHTFDAAHDAWISALAYSPDGSLAISGGDDGKVVLWDMETYANLHTFSDLGEGAEQIGSVAFNADGTRAIMVTDDARIILWDVATRAEISHVDLDGQNPSAALFVPEDEDQFIVTIENQIVLMNAESGEIMRRFIGHTNPISTRIVLGSDGQTIITAAPDGTVRLWDLNSGQEIHRLDTGIQIRSLAVNDDMTMALIGNNDETARLLDITPSSLEDTINWTQANRYMPEFTCEERLQFRLTLDAACRGELGIESASMVENDDT